MPSASAPDERAAVASPCTGICRIEPLTGWCEGCCRTLDEIVAWSGLDDAGRRLVWAAIGDRRSARAASPPPDATLG